MEEILMFENSQNLYQFLIDDYTFKVQEEMYSQLKLQVITIRGIGEPYTL